MMKSLLKLTFAVIVAMLAVSCSEDDNTVKTLPCTIQLIYPDDSEISPREGVEVILKNSTATEFKAETDNTGKATFNLPAGLYTASASHTEDDGYTRFICNGNVPALSLSEQSLSFEMNMDVTPTQLANPLLIKEIYNGGCQKNDASGAYYYDKYIIIYNNSAHTVSMDNICIGMASPYNAEATNTWMSSNSLTYASEDYVPAMNGIWYFPSTLKIGGYSQVVVALTGAIDHTKTYSNSINLASSEYYCTYDPDTKGPDGKGYENTSYYPAPADVIPSSHYLKAVKVGQGNAWPLSQLSPAVFLFQTPSAPTMCNDLVIYPPSKQGQVAQACVKVTRSWVIDAVEVFNSAKLSTSNKRLTPDLDNGYVELTNQRGHSLYRCVDKTATEAIEGNSSLLVYGSAEDPSTIDAEASIARGARIVYQDTNNSTKDMYQRDKCSLKR